MFSSVRQSLWFDKHEISGKSVELLKKIPYIGNKFNTDHRVHIHMLDQSIKEACKNFIACRTNLARGNIKHFTMSKLKFNRPNKVMHIEKTLFSEKDNTFCNKALGYVAAKYDKQKFNLRDVATTYKRDCLLKYDAVDKEYYLFVPSYIDIDDELKGNVKPSAKFIARS